MTINKAKLKKIIKEEMQKYLKEARNRSQPRGAQRRRGAALYHEDPPGSAPAHLADFRTSGNPFPELKQVQAAFPGPYNPKTPDAMGGSMRVVYYETYTFNDGEGAWGGLEDIAIIAGEKPGTIEMWHKTSGKWRFGAGVDLEPWR